MSNTTGNTKRFKKCITHGGPTAHRDEVLAIGMAIHAGVLPRGVTRRGNPSYLELDDPETIVVDAGGEYDPERGNFDHHQLNKGVEECSLSILAKNLVVPGTTKTYHEVLSGASWYRATVIRDNCGPDALAKHLGIKEVPRELMSPFEIALLGSVSDVETLTPAQEEWAETTIRTEVEYQLQKGEQLSWLEDNTTIGELGNGLKVMVIPREDTMDSQEYRRKRPDCDQIVVGVSHDDRGPGWTLYRYDDNPKVDLSVLSNNPQMGFVHKNGFLAKTKERLPLEEVITLITLAIVA